MSKISIALNPKSVSNEPPKRTIFNPLEATASSIDTRMIATARVENNIAGVCPKCGKNMTTARIANQDLVYYCEADRVATPMPDTEPLV